MSKGSSPRPLSVTDQEYAERWDAIFQRKIDRIATISDLRVQEKPEIVQDSAEIRRLFEGDEE